MLSGEEQQFSLLQTLFCKTGLKVYINLFNVRIIGAGTA
jgi:hypothetical protein